MLHESSTRDRDVGAAIRCVGKQQTDQRVVLLFQVLVDEDEIRSVVAVHDRNIANPFDDGADLVSIAAARPTGQIRLDPTEPCLCLAGPWCANIEAISAVL